MTIIQIYSTVRLSNELRGVDLFRSETARGIINVEETPEFDHDLPSIFNNF